MVAHFPNFSIVNYKSPLTEVLNQEKRKFSQTSISIQIPVGRCIRYLGLENASHGFCTGIVKGTLG